MTIYSRSEELVSRCVECDLAEPESLASLGGSAPGLVDGILSLMLDPWQLKWTENVNSTDQPNMTMSHLVDFMEQQRLFHNARQPQSRTCHNTPHRQPTYYNRGPPTNHYDNPYFSPTRGGARHPYRGGGGGHSPGGRMPMLSPGYSPPPGAGRPFNRGAGNHHGGGRGPPAGHPAGGRGRFPHQYNLHQRCPQRQLQFYQQDGYQMVSTWPSALGRCPCLNDSPMCIAMLLHTDHLMIVSFFIITLTHNKICHFTLLQFKCIKHEIPTYSK